MDFDNVQSKIDDMQPDEREKFKYLVRKYFYATYPTLASNDPELRSIGIEGALEGFEDGFAMGFFLVDGDSILVQNEDGTYDDITHLRFQILEMIDNEEG